jgi:hypothetical protein
MINQVRKAIFRRRHERFSLLIKMEFHLLLADESFSCVCFAQNVQNAIFLIKEIHCSCLSF